MCLFGGYLMPVWLNRYSKSFLLQLRFIKAFQPWPLSLLWIAKVDFEALPWKRQLKANLPAAGNVTAISVSQVMIQPALFISHPQFGLSSFPFVLGKQEGVCVCTNSCAKWGNSQCTAEAPVKNIPTHLSGYEPHKQASTAETNKVSWLSDKLQLKERTPLFTYRINVTFIYIQIQMYKCMSGLLIASGQIYSGIRRLLCT